MKPYPVRDCVVMTCRGLFSNCLMSLCIRSKGWGNLWPRAGYLTLLKISWTFLCVGSEIFFMEMWYRDSPGLQDWLILQLNLRHSWVELMFGVLHTPSSWQVTLSADQPLKHFGLAPVRENEISKKTGMGMAKKEVYDHWKIWNEVEWTRELHLAVSGLTDIIQAICAVLRSLNRAEIQLCW